MNQELLNTVHAAQRQIHFRILSDDQIEHLYRATLACLERTGVDVLNAQGRDLLVAAGARPGEDGVRVRIPPHIIEDAVAASPRSFTVWGRDPRRALELSPDRVSFGAGPSCSYFQDPFSGERRRARRDDPGLTARVCDALDHIDYVMGLALPDDVASELAPEYEFAAMLANTGKPIMAWAYSTENLVDIARMAAAAVGSEEAFYQRPILAFFTTSLAPLTHTDAEVANALWCAERGLPVVYLGGGTAGVSAPVTGAGTLVISLAAALSGLAMIQLQNRGAPVCLGCVPAPMDPRTCRPSYGAPEMSLYSAALAEVMRHLGLPFMGTAGASEAKTLDLQAAVESTIQVVFSALGGNTAAHDVGFLDCADIGSLEMLVMNDEIINLVKRMMRGIEITDEALMLDLIDEVGPGGDFLSTRETARLFRREIWLPGLFDRTPWALWEAAGRPAMQGAIKTRLRRILETHLPPPLPAGAAAEIEAILGQAEERLKLATRAG
jgi:trimethylamine---corrinoid protein Co-methyltransferase